MVRRKKWLLQEDTTMEGISEIDIYDENDDIVCVIGDNFT